MPPTDAADDTATTGDGVDDDDDAGPAADTKVDNIIRVGARHREWRRAGVARSTIDILHFTALGGDGVFS